MRFGLLAMVAGLASLAPTAWAQPPEPGDYLCTVEQRAGISKLHLEDSGPPKAFIDPEPVVKFRMRIERGPGFVVSELPYDGADANRYAFHTDNAVLHSIYLGDGGYFTAKEDWAFLTLYRNPMTNLVHFWHSGFEYPGGEDTNLAVRTGTCVREDRSAS